MNLDLAIIMFMSQLKNSCLANWNQLWAIFSYCRASKPISSLSICTKDAKDEVSISVGFMIVLFTTSFSFRIIELQKFVHHSIATVWLIIFTSIFNRNTTSCGSPSYQFLIKFLDVLSEDAYEKFKQPNQERSSKMWSSIRNLRVK